MGDSSSAGTSSQARTTYQRVPPRLTLIVLTRPRRSGSTARISLSCADRFPYVMPVFEVCRRASRRSRSTPLCRER
ncbi:hypothetical protein AB0K47_30515 [Streptomyces tirandamycinicus]|uniref:hypothetical protein n=1 Tax=Streptomyces tirandamycinicus TaxID=2174846 RepID=UPI0034227B36